MILLYEAKDLLPIARDQIYLQLKHIEKELDIKLSIDYSLLKSGENWIRIKQIIDVDEFVKIGTLLQKLENIKLNSKHFHSEAKWYGCKPCWVPEHYIRLTMEKTILDSSENYDIGELDEWLQFILHNRIMKFPCCIIINNHILNCRYHLKQYK